VEGGYSSNQKSMHIRDLREALDAFPAELRLRFGVRAGLVPGGVIAVEDDYELKREPDGSIRLILDGSLVLSAEP
jgi:hypothetical protein